MFNKKYQLGFFPTPLEPLENLSKKHKGYSLFIKRDDNSGLASGGNKVRKLQYLINDALCQGFDTVLTAGAQQSNHCRQTAAAAAKAGLECHLLLGGQKPKTYNGNLLLSDILGANIHFTGNNRKGEDLESVKQILEKQNKKVYKIPYGGSNFLGALGFVDAIKELKHQLIEKNTVIDYVFFASSSGGTQAGLQLGIDLYNLKIKLMPISIDKKGIEGKSLDTIVLDLLHKGQKKLKIEKKYSLKDAHLIKGYDSSGYGIITSNEKFAIKELAHNEGILLDPVYTARAFYAMIDYLDKNKLEKNSNVLFWHTGGLPANFYYSKNITP